MHAYRINSFKLLVAVVYIALVSLCHLVCTSQQIRKWQTFIIIPDSISKEQCTSDSSEASVSCYGLQEVIDNQSYFLSSNTLIELMPGSYNITENVGHLVINNVSNLTMAGLQTTENDLSASVSISCKQNASFGFNISSSFNITISHLHISHCSSHINSDLIEQVFQAHKRTESNLNLMIYCDRTAYVYLALCKATLVAFNNTFVMMNHTTITHSNGIGLFAMENINLTISESSFTHSRINCLMYVGTISFSKNNVSLGSYNDTELASGINIIGFYFYANITVSLIDVILQNNEGLYGNFYLRTYESDSFSRYFTDITLVNIQSIQQGSKYTNIGLILESGSSHNYIREPHHPLGINVDHCRSLFLPFASISSISIDDITDTNSQFKFSSEVKIKLILQRSIFTESCIIITNNYTLNNESINLEEITISKSKCAYALTVNNTKNLLIKDLVISESSKNMLYIINCRMLVNGMAKFRDNYSGTVIIMSSQIKFLGTVQVYNNTASDYESVLLAHYSILRFHGETAFFKNKGEVGGAISAYSSILHFETDETIIFDENSANIGGAISLRKGSVLHLENKTHILFIKNSAKLHGGGLYVEEKGLWIHDTSVMKCFAESNSETQSGEIQFENNTAGVAGSSLFGGWIDICKQDKFPPVYEFSNDNKGLTEVSSNPSRVCLCSNGIPILHKSEFEFAIFPGQTIEVQAVAVGQRFGVVPAVVKAETLYRDFKVFDEVQTLQDVGRHCNTLKYTVRSPNSHETINLLIERRCTPGGVPQPSQQSQHPDVLAQLTILVLLKNCSLGFTFDPKQNSCVCHPLLQEQGVECDIAQQRVIRKPHQWIDVTPDSGFVVHQHCPFDYCIAKSVALNLSTPDEQCAFNRSGTLCGACQPGLSHVLGTSNCKKCSNLWLFLILPFTLAGIALVMCLIVLNLTVAVGTVNGLIFYANVVRINASVFFPGQSDNTFLGWFIAWLNLDLGIETCFYNGLNSHVKAWLQFAFPVYIWLLVVFIIASSHYFIAMGKIFGNSTVQVLATLFLVSYTKLLRIAITIFQSTNLISSNGHSENVLVWLSDGNTEFFKIRHISLFVLALAFIVLMFIPFTLTVLGVQWLQKVSHFHPLFWVNKFKPVFDAYTGPYKDKHRYWTGLLLFVRIVFAAIFSANTKGDPAVNLLAIIIVITSLFVYLASIGGIYKMWPLNILEYSFLLNLVVLSAGTFYILRTESQTAMVSYVCVTITLIETLLIIFYHTSMKILKVIASKMNFLAPMHI